MKQILNFGSLNIDTVYSIPHIVRSGETISATNVESFCGGKGFNQSIALARSGCHVYHAGKIGDDGDDLKLQMEKSGVDVTFLLSSQGKSGNAFIQRSATGENCIILHGGANKEITPKEIDQVLMHFAAEDILVCQNEISNADYLLNQAAKKGMKIALNPSPIDETMLTLPLDGITWLVINEVEGSELTGESSPEKIIDVLLSRYQGLKIVLTLGDDGAVYGDSQCRHNCPSFSVPVVDTTAAGDTFLGYFISALTSNLEIPTALRLASAAAAMAVSVSGALPSIPKMEDVKRFLSERNR